MDLLIVDGYNMIGAWPNLRTLKDTDLAQARDILVQQLAEYQAVTGFKVTIVFDAHLVPGMEKKHSRHQVEIIYTKENETADERIEKMAIEKNNLRTQVYVATSDFTEQWAIFSQGALRKSARELYNEFQALHRNIERDVKKAFEAKPISKIELKPEVAQIFEKWRRGER